MQNISMIENSDLECAKIAMAYFKAVVQRLFVRLWKYRDKYCQWKKPPRRDSNLKPLSEEIDLRDMIVRIAGVQAPVQADDAVVQGTVCCLCRASLCSA
jgi:hypothetical protein